MYVWFGERFVHLYFQTFISCCQESFSLVFENCGDSIKSPRLFDGPSRSFQGQNVTENVASFSLLPLVFKNASWIVPSNIHSIMLFVELTSINNLENIVLWSWFSMSDANIYTKYPKPDCIAQTMFHNMYNTYTWLIL